MATRKKVLIVDDISINRVILNEILRKKYDVLEAASGEEALSKLASCEGSVSAMLLDISMPGIDGYEVLKAVRADEYYATLPIIMITGSEDEESRVKSLNYGANDFILKPYNAEVILHCLNNNIALQDAYATMNQLQRDSLTGLYSREAFFDNVRTMVSEHEPGYYIMASFDIARFKVINDQYGTKKGDEVLRHTANLFKNGFEPNGGICCRISADNFAVFYPKAFSDTAEIERVRTEASHVAGIVTPIIFSIGRYIVDDITMQPSAMYDRAVLAAESIKGRYDTIVAVYDETMRDKLLREQEIVTEMESALRNGNFEVWYQPQYNHTTGAMIGAEALVRWRHPQKGVISPADFIPIFERNGFIYELDLYVWEQVCRSLRRWIDEGRNPLPISVNVSRYDLFRPDIIDAIVSLINKYSLPVEALRLEITESAFSDTDEHLVRVVAGLVDYGFTVEIDDFGSGYSSLNTLKDVPAQIIKLDMKFLSNSGDLGRGGNIVESVVRMAKWIGMSVIAEGVETLEEANYLRSVGCSYIQGYFYARPMPTEKYEEHCRGGNKEEHLLTLETVENLDNNSFWDPESMDTLIFNSFVGSACIYEYHNGSIELIRATEKYVQIIGSTEMTIEDALKLNWQEHLSKETCARTYADIVESAATKKEIVGEYVFYDLPGCPHETYLRASMRVIATSGDRYLVYCMNENITAQRQSENRERAVAEEMRIIMENLHGGICSAAYLPDGNIKIIFANDMYYEMRGYTKEQYEAEVRTPFDSIVEEDKARISNEVARLALCGGNATYEYRCKKRDGQLITIRCNNSVIKLSGRSETVLLSVTTDTTELALARRNEQQLKDRLEIIMRNIDAGVLAAAMDGDKLKIIFANDMFYQQIGYSVEDYSSEFHGEFMTVFPEDIVQIMQHVAIADVSRQPYSVEYRVKRPDGEIRYIHSNVTVIDYPGFDMPVQLAVNSDITEARIAEQNIRRISEQFQAIMDNVDLGIIAATVKDNEAEYIFVNDRYYEMLGYSKSEFDGVVTSPFMTIAPEDIERMRQETARINETGESALLIYTAINKNGERRTFRSAISIGSLSGTEGPVQLSVIRDITEEQATALREKQAAEQARAIMDDMISGVVAWVLVDGKISNLFANDRYYALHGYLRNEHGMLTVEHFSNVHPDDRERVRNTCYAAHESNEPVQFVYRIVRSSNNEVRWIRAGISHTRFTGIDGVVHLSIFTDITDAKLSEQKLIEKDEQLRFLNDMSHELLAEPDTDNSITAVLTRLMEYFCGDRAYIFEFDNKNETATNTYEVCAKGISSEIVNLKEVPFSLFSEWLEAFKTQGCYVIQDVETLDSVHAHTKEKLAAQNINSLFVVPLRRDGEIIGMIGVDNPTKTLTQAERLITLGDYIAVILTRRDLNLRIGRDKTTLNDMMEDMPGGFARMRVHSDGRIVPTYFNERLLSLVGMTRDEVMEIYAGDVRNGIHPDDVCIVNEAMTKMLKEGVATSARYRLKRGNDGYIWLSIFGRTSVDNAGNTFLNIYFTDANEKVAEEERQKELLDNLPGGTAIFEYDNKKLTIAHLNKSFWELIDSAPIPEIDKNRVTFALHPDDKTIVFRELEAAIEQHRDMTCDIRLYNNEKGYIPVRLDGRIVKAGDEKYFIYTIFTPITDESMSYQQMLPLLLSAIMDSTTDLTFAKDTNFRYLSASRAFAVMAGYEHEDEVIGKTDYDLFDKELADKYRHDDEELIKNNTAIIDQIESIPSDNGIPKYSRTSKYLLRDGAGEVVGLYGVGRDVTESVRQDSQLRLLNDSIPGGLATYICTKGEFTPEHVKLSYFNDGFCKLFGYTRGEYASRAKVDPMSMVVEEDKHIIAEQWYELMNNGTASNCLYRAHTKNDGYKWINHRAVVAEQSSEGKTIINAILQDVTDQRELIERLRISQEENGLALQQGGNIVCRYIVADKCLSITPEIAAMYSLPEKIFDVPYEPVRLGMISPESADAYIGFFESIIRGSKAATATFQQKYFDKWRWMEARSTTIFSDDLIPIKAVISLYDVTEKLEKETIFRRWQQSLSNRPIESYSLFRCNLNRDSSYAVSEGGLLDFDFNNAGTNFNERASAYVRQYVSDEDKDRYIAFANGDTLLAGYYRGKRSLMLEYRENTDNGNVRWLRLTVDLIEQPTSTEVEAYLMYEDIDDIKKSELQTKELSETDPLTGVFNRVAFAERVDDIIRNSRNDTRHALFMIDIDGFKQINDVFGHGAGDNALVDIANVLRSTVRADDIVGRLGGDEFVVFLCNVQGDGATASKARQICSMLRKSFSLEVQISASIGISAVPRDGMDFATLYKKADAALYHVKGLGKNSHAFYHDNMSDQHLDPEPDAPNSTGSGVAEKKRRMLIVDDSKIDYALLQNIFRDEYIIEKARDGSSALIRLRHYENAISVVLLDLMMPGMDGFTVLEKMQSSIKLRSIPVIIVSGDESRDTCLRAIRHGATDFITKPVDEELLRIRVSSAVSRAENERLRAKNCLLEAHDEERIRYESAIDSAGITFVECNWHTGAFTYHKSISEYLYGNYDNRRFWQILLSDMVTDTRTVQEMQQLVHRIAEDRQNDFGSICVKLKNPNKVYHNFRVNVRKLTNEFQLTNKLVISLIDLDYTGE